MVLQLSLATKIFLGFCILLLGFGLLAVLSVAEIRNSGDDLRALKDVQLALARLSTQLETQQQNRFRDLRRAAAEPDGEARRLLLRVSLAYFPEAVQRTLRDITERVGPGSKADDDDFARTVLGHVQRVAAGHRELDRLTRAWIEGPAPPPEDEIRTLESELRTETYLLDKRISDQTEEAVRRAVQQERTAVWRILGMTVFALAVGLTVTVLAARALAPISQLVRHARAISRGDYDHPSGVSSKGEFGRLAEELTWMAKAQKAREQALDRSAAELERAYRRVEELKRYHENIVRSLRTGVVVVDEDCAITSANPAAREVWGVDPEPSGMTPIDATEVGRVLASVDPGWSEGPGLSLQSQPIHDRLADVVVAPFLDERGRQRGRLIALEDVTEAVRTKEALIRSERLAAIGRMSAHVTHEIRNPLSSVGLNVEMLRDWLEAHPDSDEAQSLCTAIEREIDRLTELTDEYLRFARLPAPELRQVDVRDFLNTLANFVRPECRAAQVSVQVSAPESANVWMDPDQMRQAMLNLIRNAKEAMPGGGAIEVGADDRGTLWVEDGGPGIPEDALPHIFDPFYSTKLTGTGLGLALVQQIVQEHGGELQVRPLPEGGTRFTLNLQPRGSRPIREKPCQEDPDTPPAPAAADRRKSSKAQGGSAAG